MTLQTDPTAIQYWEQFTIEEAQAERKRIFRRVYDTHLVHMIQIAYRRFVKSRR